MIMPATWLIPENELTVEQQRAVTLDPSKPRVILGPPGSGKTVILAHRAKYLCETYKVRPTRCMILTYTKSLSSYIRAGLRDLGLDLRLVQPLDAWCRSFYQTFLGPLPKTGQYAGPEGPRRAVREHLLNEWDRGRLFDFVLVDEAQELDQASFDIMSRIAEHVTMFQDETQRRFDAGKKEREASSFLGQRQTTTALLEGFRCTPHIAGLAARFIPDPEQAERFLMQTRTLSPEKEKPVLFVARDDKEELENLVSTLQARQSLGERIAVLVPSKKHMPPIFRACQDQGLHVEGPTARSSGQGANCPAYDFSTDRPKIMTYQSARGLTFDTVLLPRLSTGHFRGIIASKISMFLFLGITRAVRWVYLSAIRNQPISPIRSLNQLEQHSPEEADLSVTHGRYERQLCLTDALKTSEQARPQKKYNQEEIEDPAETGDEGLDDLF